MIAISPAIVLSVATRLQTKRIELATNASQTYIDGVRSGAIAAPPITDTDTFPTPNEVEFPIGGSLDCPIRPAGATPAPTAFYCTTETPNSYLYCINNDNSPDGCTLDSTKDMIVQGFGIGQDPSPDKGYQLGVRVYRADAFKDSDALKKSNPSNKVEAFTVTSGLGDRKAPLVETTTEIVTNKTTYSDFCKRLNPPPADPNYCK